MSGQLGACITLQEAPIGCLPCCPGRSWGLQDAALELTRWTPRCYGARKSLRFKKLIVEDISLAGFPFAVRPAARRPCVEIGDALDKRLAGEWVHRIFSDAAVLTRFANVPRPPLYPRVVATQPRAVALERLRGRNGAHAATGRRAVGVDGDSAARLRARELVAGTNRTFAQGEHESSTAPPWRLYSADSRRRGPAGRGQARDLVSALGAPQHDATA